jgi:hypothetical protein
MEQGRNLRCLAAGLRDAAMDSGANQTISDENDELDQKKVVLFRSGFILRQRHIRHPDE